MRAGPALLLLGVALTAQAAEKESLPPGVAEIVAAERAFAKKGAEVGVRASFLEYFSDDAISYEPDPGPARPRLEKRPPLSGPPPRLLEWAPAQAEIAPGGDMGWTTGPARLTDKSSNQVIYHGQYFSIWKKTAAGWKVALDVGVDAPAADMPTVATAVGATKAYPHDEPAWGPQFIELQDRLFCEKTAAGAGKAYAEALAKNGRVHREKQGALVGEKQWRPWAKTLSGVIVCKTAGAGASRAPGFGYAYGSWERHEKPDGPVVEKGFYAHVWRWDGGWKLAVDVSTLAE